MSSPFSLPCVSLRKTLRQVGCRSFVTVTAVASLSVLLGNSVALAQSDKKPAPLGNKVAPQLPQLARLDFPLPGVPGVEFGSIAVQRPGVIGAVEAKTRAPGGPNWEEFLILKDGKSIFQFGFLLGLSTVSDSSLENCRLKDCLLSIAPIPEKCSESLLTFRIVFKWPATADAFGESGSISALRASPVAYSDCKGGLARAMNLNAIDVSMRRGPMSIAYDPFELSLISERAAAHELTLSYISAMRLSKSGRYLINPNRLFQILNTYKAVPDVNEETSFGGTSKKRFTALANLINSEMAQWDECLYDALEPETDTENGLRISGAQQEEPKIPKPGEKPQPPGYKRIMPLRIFRKVRLPIHELAMVKRLEEMKSAGASAEEIRTYRALVNRILLDRLMVDHWDKTGYLFKSSLVQRGMTLVGAADLNRMSAIMGTDIPAFVPAPTELLRITVSVPKEVPKAAPKPEAAPQRKRPFTIPEDFNPLTHEVLYDRDGNPVEVRRKQP